MIDEERELIRLEKKVLYYYNQFNIIKTASNHDLIIHMDIAIKYEEYEICNKIKVELSHSRSNQISC